MPCYHPVSAYRTSDGVVFTDTIDATPIKLPCGRCIGCRLERSRQWAVRLVHENRFHDHSSFLTLTYDEDHLPKDGSLNLKHFQDFMKRLRKSYGYTKLRFFHAGEYGEKNGRPHYHAIVFGTSLMDGVTNVESTPRGDTTWESTRVNSLWPFGLHRIGRVTFESCAYVARYVTKKKTGREALTHYERVCENTGEVFRLRPEYCTMSRRPGIGAAHFGKFWSEIYPSDQVVSRGHAAKPPKFYDRMLEKHNPSMYARVKDDRECALASSSIAERSPSRLFVKETVKLAQIGHLQRRYEIG